LIAQSDFLDAQSAVASLAEQLLRTCMIFHAMNTADTVTVLQFDMQFYVLGKNRKAAVVYSYTSASMLT
jgi:hypothetical protein